MAYAFGSLLVAIGISAAMASACSDAGQTAQQAASASGSGGTGGGATTSVTSTATTGGIDPAGVVACTSYCARLDELCGETPSCAEECDQELVGPCASSVIAYAQCLGESATACGDVPGGCYDEVLDLASCARDQCVFQGCGFTDAASTKCQCQISCDANAYLDLCEVDATGSRCSCYLNGFPLGTCESGEQACGSAPTNCCDQYLAGPGM
jgi:hypothetical protein